MNNLKIFTDNIEPEALNQVYTLIKQPAFAECKVRIMPDVHAGAGCVIGFTADLGEKVIPNIVGVDIGCGMLTVELGNIDLDLATVDQIIRAKVPSGRNVHEGRPFPFDRLKELRCYRELKDTKRLERSIGTLGGGNHFIEVDVDEDGVKYLIIHTGSRNLGKQVAEYYQNLAVEIMQGKDELYAKQEQLIAEYKAQGRSEVRDFYFQCGAGILVGSIMANGDIGACLDIERRPELIQGNIRRDDFVDVWENRYQAFRRNRAEESAVCRDCEHREYCMGDSTHTWDFDRKEPRYCAVKRIKKEG